MEMIQVISQGKTMNRIIVVIAVFLLLVTNLAHAAQCEDIHPNYRNGGGRMIGPFDYSDPIMQKRQPGTPLELVESAHFTEAVRTLKGGNTTQMPGGDLSYTLWAFPNHHPALLTLIAYTVKHQSEQPPQMRHTAECYFTRAVQWRPKDAKTRLVYGIYQFKRHKITESIEQFLAATNLDPENGNAYYNLGLAYFENKNYEQALRAAHSAYALGFTMDGLKNKLTRAGRWTPPAPQSPTPPLPTLRDAAGIESETPASE